MPSKKKYQASHAMQCEMHAACLTVITNLRPPQMRRSEEINKKKGTDTETETDTETDTTALKQKICTDQESISTDGPFLVSLASTPFRAYTSVVPYRYNRQSGLLCRRGRLLFSTHNMVVVLCLLQSAIRSPPSSRARSCPLHSHSFPCPLV